MRTLTIPGGGPGENLPSGAFAVPVPPREQTPDGGFRVPGYVETHIKRLELPRPDSWPLYVRAAETRVGFQICGQSANAVTGTWHFVGTWVLDPRICNGQSAAIFDYNGTLRIIEPGVGVSSQGYRNIADDGSLVSGDSTYLDLARDLSEFTEYAINGEIVAVGQGHERGGAVALWRGNRYLLAPGDCRFIRFSHVADSLAIAIARPGHTLLLWLTVGELASFPFDTGKPALPPIVVPPVNPNNPPKEPPVNPHNPPPPPSVPIAPNRFDVVQRVVADHPEIDRVDDATRGQIVVWVVRALGGFPWGRKDRDQNPNTDNNSGDALCYRLQDNRFEIYDIMGGNGNPLWDYKGTFADGENGYFRAVPIAPAETPPPPFVPPPPPPMQGPDISTKIDSMLTALAVIANTLQVVAVKLDVIGAVPPPFSPDLVLTKLSDIQNQLAHGYRNRLIGILEPR